MGLIVFPEQAEQPEERPAHEKQRTGHNPK
jgi:hypothetical protein